MEKLPIRVKQFITENKVAHVATISADQKRPQIATVYYVFDKDTIYFATRPESVKVKNIEANKHTSLVITDSAKLITLQLECVSEIVKDIKLKSDIVYKYNQVSNEAGPLAFPPLTKTVGNSVEIVKCPIKWFRYSDFSDSDQSMVEGNINI